MNEQGSATDPCPRVVVFACTANLALLAFAIFIWINKSRINDEEFLIFSGDSDPLNNDNGNPVFHSFRNTFISYLERKFGSVTNDIQNAIGHGSDKNAVRFLINDESNLSIADTYYESPLKS